MKFTRWLISAFFSGALACTTARAVNVTLTWTDNSNNEQGFRVYKAIGAGAFVALSQTAANVPSYVEGNVAPGTYSYKVAAFNVTGESVFSNTATITVPPAGTVPSAPGSMTVEIPGDLINMSTRGYITETATTLISGLVVANGKVKALIRVVGPTLGVAPFNVPGVCADPRFDIVNQATGAVVASSDNWSGQAVADAAAAVFAFELPVGSKDAAIVVTLAPGQYTVVALGVAGATGVGLAEVYKVP